ncbi:uncharacterized protein TRIADDRAFT_61951 [Trichoplax adhaerens]|uniref:EGF-like domain-containing protein n=1 Tax=Trichoplax adhaerens TaxID=10228 RepID=B3SCF3_TRIAD|nr:hypothetical protein TRIADDRAFT_61951 [Trichoplax adhaerens]EDV19583.1 hypothetical protein TRIADDRAFT_61951 [Trichoplax adhaerens]|eukprot:XP_002117916.1 hypothetical protein TRIADDRAFT_61951 [Trichoplax adhaerens]
MSMLLFVILSILFTSSQAIDACKNHRVVSSMESYIPSPRCNRGSEKDWYRFVVQNTSSMIATCSDFRRRYKRFLLAPTIAMKGHLPKASDGIVNRTTCSGQFDCLCYETTNIQVKRCNNFFVYRLPTSSSKPCGIGAYLLKQADKCSSNPCRNGKCISGPTGYACQCKAGYYGRNCESTKCPRNFCFNGGKCVTSRSGYHCRCSTGYIGKNCEIEVKLLQIR